MQRPTLIVVEELQVDEDAEREARVLEWIELVEACRRIGTVAALIFAIALATAGVFS